MNSADFTSYTTWYWNSLLSSLISSGENSMHFLQLMSFTILQFSFHQVSNTAGWTEAHDMRDWGSNSWPLDHDSTFYVTETPALTTRPSVTLPIHIQCQCAVILQWLKNTSLMYFFSSRKNGDCQIVTQSKHSLSLRICQCGKEAQGHFT